MKNSSVLQALQTNPNSIVGKLLRYSLGESDMVIEATGVRRETQLYQVDGVAAVAERYWIQDGSVEYPVTKDNFKFA